MINTTKVGKGPRTPYFEVGIVDTLVQLGVSYLGNGFFVKIMLLSGNHQCHVIVRESSVSCYCQGIISVRESSESFQCQHHSFVNDTSLSTTCQCQKTISVNIMSVSENHQCQHHSFVNNMSVSGNCQRHIFVRIGSLSERCSLEWCSLE